MGLWSVSCVALSVWLGAASARAAPARRGEVRRFVVAIGANDGGRGRAMLRYAVDDAKSVGEVLGELGGARPADRLLLEEPSPDDLLWAVGGMLDRVEAAKRSGAKVQFILYYSGHSDESGLLLGEERFDYKDLRALVDLASADVRVVILDSCASGAFTRSKGGRKRPAFMVGEGADVQGHAFVTSSAQDEVAQESDRVGGSYFTHFLTTGLRGAADTDGDRRVTLSEAYAFASDETLAQTEASRGGAQHAAYDIDLRGSTDLVLTDLRRPSARLELPAALEGRVFVRRVGGALAAELYMPPGGDAVVLALEPGRYRVTVDDGERVLRAEVALKRRQRTTVAVQSLREIPREATRARGAESPTQYVDIRRNIALVPTLSTNARSTKGREARLDGIPVRNAVSLGVLWSRSGAIDGAALGLGGTVVTHVVEGAQLSGVANVSLGHVHGLQITGVVNHTYGLQGAQLAFVNLAGPSRGAQVGMVNRADDLEGAQVGLVNVAGRVSGAQVGLVSFADQASAQVSVLGYTRAGGIHPEIFTSDVAGIGVGLRLPAERTYTGVALGLHPAGPGAAWTTGVVFGVHSALPHRLFVDVDVTSNAVIGGAAMRGPAGALFVPRLTLGWQAARRFAVMGGPTFNLMLDRLGAEQRSTVRPGYGWVTRTTHPGRARARIWPGFVLGIRL